MQSKIDKQVQNPFKSTEIKSPEGDKIFAACTDGSLIELSMISKTIVYDDGRILDDIIFSIAKTNDNKSQFLCGYHTGFIEIHIPTRKKLRSYTKQRPSRCVVTHDNKFLVTYENKNGIGFITKWSVRTKKKLHTWQFDVQSNFYWIRSQSCSYDNKYQFIGYEVQYDSDGSDGYLGIFELQKHQTRKCIIVMPGAIISVAFPSDNQSVFLSGDEGFIKLFKWKEGNFSKDDVFEYEKSDWLDDGIRSICLTKDDKYLLVGSSKSLSVFETKTRKVTKEFKLTDQVVGISLVKDNKYALIAEENGNFSIIDLETLEIFRIATDIIDGKKIDKIMVI